MRKKDKGKEEGIGRRSKRKKREATPKEKAKATGVTKATGLTKAKQRIILCRIHGLFVCIAFAF